jgi:hypothetical protein
MAFWTVEQFCKERRFNKSRGYELAKRVLPAGVVVRFGRQVRINVEALRTWESAGGAPLPGGWKREPEGRPSGR